MFGNEDDDKTTFIAVVNGEEQYSIWPASKTIPNGWFDTGTRGTRKECLDYIERVWVDMRPKSVRLGMEKNANTTPTPNVRKSEHIGNPS